MHQKGRVKKDSIIDLQKRKNIHNAKNNILKQNNLINKSRILGPDLKPLKKMCIFRKKCSKGKRIKF